MNVNLDQASTEAILRRIETIMRELETLRQTVLAGTKVSASNPTRQLFGSLGTGSWTEYDVDLDWQQFAE